MGLKDNIAGLFGGKKKSSRGRRVAATPARGREDATVQVGGGAGAHPDRVTSPAVGGAPPPVAPQPPPAVAAPPPGPIAPAPVATPAPAPTPGKTGAETIYFEVDKLHKRGVVGVLVGIDGDLEGQIFAVGPGQNSVGREGCDILVKDDLRISRKHASIEQSGEIFAVKPLNDMNPVLLNGQRVVGAEALSDGDAVRLGGSTLRFRTIEGL